MACPRVSGGGVGVFTPWTEMLVPRVMIPIDWIAGLGCISTRTDKVLTVAQPDRQGSERGTTHSWPRQPRVRRTHLA